jgi:ABC-type branched-subunit amino acid transport system substrate-binding protein
VIQTLYDQERRRLSQVGAAAQSLSEHKQSTQEQEGGTVKKRYLLAGVFALVVVAALLAVACGGGDEVTTTTGVPTTTLPPATGELIKIGHIVDATGVEATTGVNMKKSLELAFAAINDRIGDRPIKIITEDAADDPNQALARAKKLVEQDEVMAIFGPTAIGEKYTVSNYMKTVGIPLIIYSPSPEVIFKDNPWVVAAGGTNLQQPTCMADYVYNTLGYKKVDTIAPEGAAGATFLGPFTAEFEALGGTIVDAKTAPQNTLDFSSILTTLKPADALVYWFPGADAQRLVVAFDQLGITMPKVGAFHGATFDPYIFKDLNNPEAAAAMAGTPTPMEYDPQLATEANNTFIALWEAAQPTTSGPLALDGSNANPYDAAQLFIKVLEANGGDTSPEALMTGMLSTSWEGPQGPAFFDATSDWPQVATRNVYIVEVTANPVGSEWPYYYKTVKTYEAVSPHGFGK